MKSTEEKIIKFIRRENLLQNGDRVIVALSGGADSVFALHFFHKFQKLFDIKLYAYHLNHMLRGTDADKDEAFSINICEELGIKLKNESADVKKFAENNKYSLEEGARVLRYKNLQAYAEEIGPSKIITAHNKSDNTETVLLNLFKGSGISGITGIPVKRDNIIRPLLVLDSTEIRTYLAEAGYEYRTDVSNFQNDYLRNYLRNEIIPLLQENINPAIDDAVFRNSFILRELNELVNDKVEAMLSKAVTKKDGGLKINYTNLDMEEQNIIGHLYRRCFELLDIPYSYSDYLKLKDLNNSITGTRIEFESLAFAYKDREHILIKKGPPSSEEINIKIRPGERVKIGEIEIGIDVMDGLPEIYNSENTVEYIDLGETDGEFTLSLWNRGDRFIPFGKNTEKKISEFLVDEKIESYNKKNQLVLKNRNNIVWVVGLRLDNRYRIKKETKQAGKLWMK